MHRCALISKTCICLLYSYLSTFFISFFKRILYREDIENIKKSLLLHMTVFLCNVFRNEWENSWIIDCCSVVTLCNIMQCNIILHGAKILGKYDFITRRQPFLFHLNDVIFSSDSRVRLKNI